nr:hypothetical protein Iba_chr12cCG1070 [Ipomoea batatas]
MKTKLTPLAKAKAAQAMEVDNYRMKEHLSSPLLIPYRCYIGFGSALKDCLVLKSVLGIEYGWLFQVSPRLVLTVICKCRTEIHVHPFWIVISGTRRVDSRLVFSLEVWQLIELDSALFGLFSRTK